jgi:hypothetical protein
MPRDASSTGLRAGFDNLSAVVEAAGSANIVRKLELAAVRALLERRCAERMMATTHIPPRRRGFSLGDSHAAPVTFNVVFRAPADLSGQSKLPRKPAGFG